MPNPSSIRWRKSSHSGNNGGNCLEVASGLPGAVAVRDSKNPAGPVLIFAKREWETFLDSLKTAI